MCFFSFERRGVGVGDDLLTGITLTELSNFLGQDLRVLSPSVCKIPEVPSLFIRHYYDLSSLLLIEVIYSATNRQKYRGYHDKINNGYLVL